MKICKYCMSNSDEIDGLRLDFSDKSFFDVQPVKSLPLGIAVDIRDKHMNLYFGDFNEVYEHKIKTLKINYCPICGRNLNKED